MFRHRFLADEDIYNGFTDKENEETIYNRCITAFVLFKRHGTEKELYI